MSLFAAIAIENTLKIMVNQRQFYKLKAKNDEIYVSEATKDTNDSWCIIAWSWAFIFREMSKKQICKNILQESKIIIYKHKTICSLLNAIC